MFNWVIGIPLITLLAAATLAIVVIQSGRGVASHLSLSILLVLIVLWTFGSVMAHSIAFPSTLFWMNFMLACAFATSAVGVHFATQFAGLGGTAVAWLVRAFYLLGGFSIAVALSYGFLDKATLLPGGALELEFGPLTPLAWGFTVAGLIIALMLLVSKFWGTAPKAERTRIIFLIVGYMVLGFGALSDQIFGTHPAGIAANLVFASLLSYGGVSGHLLEAPRRISRLLSLSATALMLALCFGATFIFAREWLKLPADVSLILATLDTAIFGVAVIAPLRTSLTAQLTRFLFPHTYRHRQALSKLSDVDRSLAGWGKGVVQALDMIAGASHAEKIVLLLRNNETGYFEAKHAAGRDWPTLLKLKFGTHSPLVTLLARRGAVLDIRESDQHPALTDLSPNERDSLRDAGITIFCGVNTGDGLIAVLALKREWDGGWDRDEDEEFLRLACNQIALNIQNELTYAGMVRKAITDEVTGLFNHRYFLERLEEETDRALRYAQQFALLLCDFDLFKSFNDTYGHRAGDVALHNIAAHMRNSLRETDLAFRYGGDEFALILPNTDANGAAAVAERIRHSVLNTPLAAPRAPEEQITLSIGIASFLVDGLTGIQLIDEADMALRRAKKEGGDRCCIASDNVPSELVKEAVARARQSSGEDAVPTDWHVLQGVYAFVSTAEAKVPHFHGHSDRVARYAVAIGMNMGLTDKEVRNLRAAALLHDIGKIVIPEAPLRQPFSLTDSETALIRRHPVVGARIVARLPGSQHLITGVLYHHERLDGSGYPEGLTGDSIPMQARIVAIADTYEAMTAQRLYRQHLSHDEAVTELKQRAGSQFDARAVQAFLDMFQSNQPSYSR